MTLTPETVNVRFVDDGLVCLDHHRPESESRNPTRSLWLSAENAPWLIEQISAVLDDWRRLDVEADLNADHFKVFVGGPDAFPVLFIHNRRAEDAPHGGLCGVRLDEAATASALAQLRQAIA